MASTHIEINPNSTRMSGEFTGIVREVQRTTERASYMVDRINSLSVDNDWAALGAALNVSEADAQTIYNLLMAAWARFNHNDIENFCNRLG